MYAACELLQSHHLAILEGDQLNHLEFRLAKKLAVRQLLLKMPASIVLSYIKKILQGFCFSGESACAEKSAEPK